ERQDPNPGRGGPRHQQKPRRPAGRPGAVEEGRSRGGAAVRQLPLTPRALSLCRERARWYGDTPQTLAFCARSSWPTNRWVPNVVRVTPREVDIDVDMDVDIVIVGAGISGLDAAYRLTERDPHLTYTILERRAQIGGTWDLFRYPGVRSDSSIFTLSFPFEPWTRRESVADGDHIREYLADTARKYGIDHHIQFGSHVRSADWDSASDT